VSIFNKNLGGRAMSSKVISFSQKQKKVSEENEFIALLDKDISNGVAKEIPNSVFSRIADIKHKALLARERNELQEM
jgi:hypothetical protein